MNNSLSMTADFERQKNIKALAITLGIAGALLLLFILLKWNLPAVPPVPTQEFLEVNLGTDDFGSGKDQPLLPGEPAPAKQTAYTPPQPIKAVADDVKDVETDDREETDAPAIRKPVVAKPNATRIDDDNKTVKQTTATTPQPVTQAPPKPRAVLGRTTGGNGNGGNGAETYKPGSGEGIAGGSGDQGRPGGDPNGTNYKGTPSRISVGVISIKDQSFQDDFNENAKITMDLEVSPQGKLTSAKYQPRGSTSNNRKLIEIATRRAYQIEFAPTTNGQKGPVTFDFKVRG